jgi:hypothetical protein
MERGGTQQTGAQLWLGCQPMERRPAAGATFPEAAIRKPQSLRGTPRRNSLTAKITSIVAFACKDSGKRVLLPLDISPQAQS